jgi:hypothetical protein
MHAVKQYEAHDGAFTGANIKRLDYHLGSQTLEPETIDWPANDGGRIRYAINY